MQTQVSEAPKKPASTTYAYWKYSASEATQNHRYLWPAVLQRLPASGLRVLDAGCGNGAFSRVLAERGYEVSGCDLSESGIAVARKASPECRFECLSVYDDFLAAFGEPFDVIVSIEVVEHLYDPDTFIKRVREALAPGGLFVMTTPYHGYWKNLLIAASGKGDTHYNPLQVGGHIKFWSRKSMAALLHRNGFEIQSFGGAGRMPGLWKSMVVVARAKGE
jgi:2-polyprenyl-3-methyl-5-hydroxy-6-metoxy-1,4-benzoquinol methylase